MDKLKLFNLFLLAFLLSLAVQSFFWPQKNAWVDVIPGVVMSIESDSVTIPNIPKITVKNTSTGSLTFHPCDDVSITINSQLLGGIKETFPSFCHDLTVVSGSSALLPMNELYQVFSNTKNVGKYTTSLATPYGERIVAYDVEAPGIIRSTLSALVFEPIYNLFVALITYLPGHSLGWAIIIVTIIVRIILLAPQQHMLEWQKKLQKLQPKIKALQKEYKNDQATLGMKMLELYKTEWVNPMASIVPLLIQMPILIGLYWVISGITEPSNFYHLYSFFSSFRPSEISTVFFGLDLSHVGGLIGLAFAIVLGLLQYVQAKLSFVHIKKQESKKEKETEIVKKDDETPEFALDPELMQKIMLYFLPLTVAISSYFFPLGIWVYWFVGTLFVIAQQAYVNRKK